MMKYLPLPDINVDNGSDQLHAHVADHQQLRDADVRGKVEHKFTDKVSLTGFYLYNRTDEPCSNYFGSADQTEPNRFADPHDYILKRRPQILALNNTWVLSDSSVLALRFGMTRFPDNNTLTLRLRSGDARLLADLHQPDRRVPKFPQVRIDAATTALRPHARRDQPDRRSTGSRRAPTAAYSKFVGTHTFKFGADFRKIGVDLLHPGQRRRHLRVRQGVHLVERLEPAARPTATRSPSFLLGYPSAIAGNASARSRCRRR